MATDKLAGMMVDVTTARRAVTDETMTAGTALDAARVAWAKSSPYGGEPEAWLPLWQHLDDSADAAALLWDHWLSRSTRDLLASALPGGHDDARRLVVWLAGVHDVGKASPAFAFQVSSLWDRLRRLGLPVGTMLQTDRSALRHEVAGAVILERWLATHAPGLGRRHKQFTAVVGGHHGAFPDGPRMRTGRTRSDLLGDGLWTDLQNLLLDRAAQRAGVHDVWPRWAEVRLSPAIQMILSGIVVMADWLASTEELFPLLDIGHTPPFPMEPHPHAPGRPLPAGKTTADLTAAPARIRQAWAQLGVSPGWRPSVPSGSCETLFRQRFPAVDGSPRPVQEAAFRAAMTMAAPGLMIIEAPMGEGKTEAGLLAAEVLAARTGAQGSFTALPTQATSNAMFERIVAWLGTLPSDGGPRDRSTALLHGKAALNDGFARLPRSERLAQIFEEDPDDTTPRHLRAGAHNRDPGLRATVHDWFRGRKRAGLSDFAVGTIDQVLFAALTARHVMLRHLSLATKVVIIDEVHAADVFMSRFLDRALEWLAAEGAPVILLSATLPAQRRLELYTAYEAGRRHRLDPSKAASRPDEPAAGAADLPMPTLAGRLGYPSIVTSGDRGPVVETLTPSGRASTVRLSRLDDDLTTLTQTLARDLRDGGCAVVIRNTVRRVQEAAQALSEHFGTANVTVAHAGFLAIDRAAKDADLLRRFGPPGPGTDRPRGPHVVVASQVVEQSLDVDFDVMVTDVAPVDLVLQRMGRLHRHLRADRPAPLRRAQCYLTGVDWAAAPPQPVQGSRNVYGAWALYRSLAVLAPRWDDGEVRLPQDIPELVQEAYDLDGEVPAAWAAAVQAAWNEEADERQKRRSTADAFALPGVGRAGDSLLSFSRGSVGPVDEDSAQRQGYVRDGGESIEVVVVQRGEDGVDRIPDWVSGGGEALPLRHEPVPYEQARLLARCTVRLPFTLVAHHEIIGTVLGELEQDWFEGWRHSPALSGALGMVLDGTASRSLAGRLVRYDQRLGLLVSELE